MLNPFEIFLWKYGLNIFAWSVLLVVAFNYSLEKYREYRRPKFKHLDRRFYDLSRPK